MFMPIATNMDAVYESEAYAKRLATGCSGQKSPGAFPAGHELSMANAGAVVAAVTLLESPRAVRRARLSRLPRGITFLLEVAAGEAHAVSEAIKITGRAEHVLKSAAGFFIEQ